MVSADQQSKAAEEGFIESEKEVADLKKELQTHIMAADRYKPSATHSASSLCMCGFNWCQVALVLLHHCSGLVADDVETAQFATSKASGRLCLGTAGALRCTVTSS